MKKIQNITMVYSGDDWDREIPYKNHHTREYYETTLPLFEESGFRFYKVAARWYDEEKGVFKKAWEFKNGKWLKINKNIKPDIYWDATETIKFYNRYRLLSEIKNKIPVINNPHFRYIMSNKIFQYSLFKKSMSPTWAIHNKTELTKYIKKAKGNKVVIKPIYGHAGNGVMVDLKTKILKTKIKYPILLQEFINGENGIPGSKEKNFSDLRIVFVNHKPIYANSRTAHNSYITNCHAGGVAKEFSLEKVPKNVWNAAKQIQENIKQFDGCHYSLDFLFTKTGKPVLVELNCKPGVDLLNRIGNLKIKKKYLDALLTSI
jgi:glutathione synthase/RimK-type ligase-like ATP-grasp enzyme